MGLTIFGVVVASIKACTYVTVYNEDVLQGVFDEGRRTSDFALAGLYCHLSARGPPRRTTEAELVHDYTYKSTV